MKTTTTLSLQPFVFLDPPAFFPSALPLGLADEVPDLGGEAFALGRPHARRVPGDLLRRLFHFLAQFGAARLGLGIEVGDTGHLDELFLRLLEARDGIALPGFRLTLLAAFFCFSLRPLRPLLLRSLCRTLLLRTLGACGFHPAPLGVVEGGVLGPRAGKPFFQIPEVFEVVAPGVKLGAFPMAG